VRFCLAGAFDTLWSFPGPLPIMDEHLQTLEHAQETAIDFGSLRQLDVVTGVACGTDIRQALAAIRDMLAAHPKTLHEPEPMIRVQAQSVSSVNIAIRPWTSVDDYYDTSSEINRAVLETFRECGIQIFFPQREGCLLDSATLVLP